MRKELMLRGLDCAHCAQKMEDGVSKLKEVKSVSVNFTTSKMNVEIDFQADTQHVLGDIKKIVNSIESHVVVLEEKQLNEEDSNHLVDKKALMRLILGATF